MTGDELRTRRRAVGLTQQQLAQQTGFTRDTVRYWECKAIVDTSEVAPRRFCEVLGVRGSSTPNARARGWGVTPGDIIPTAQAAALETRPSFVSVSVSSAPGSTQQPALCGARTRKGLSCRNKPEPGRTRCKFHGGKSTGPGTADGRARIAEAQRRRWAKWRALHDDVRCYIGNSEHLY
ncbi:HGGxSTG domain-containing protein [Rubellimicrobium roseum]|uniref:Helix-turn-helix domain-containing protein n=1 Tax=Rubellimicrobium roseum TaxID=687525 RepID=A0A5C4NIY4_9RHOB|nr:helix-turn-helix domain-containing protein [Rubellimicrobium roseum]